MNALKNTVNLQVLCFILSVNILSFFARYYGALWHVSRSVLYCLKPIFTLTYVKYGIKSTIRYGSQKITALEAN